VRAAAWLSALFVITGAIVIVVISEIAAAFACGEGQSCDGLSSPLAMRVMAWVTLGGIVVGVTSIVLRRRLAVAAFAVLTGLSFVAWLLLFVYVVEGDL
jgi:hypothetical protein